MNAVATPQIRETTPASESLRQWITELTDYTPQQVERIVAQLEKQKVNGSAQLS